MLIVPLNFANSHWACGAIDFKRKRLLCFDSLGFEHPTFHDTMRDLLRKEWVHKVSGGRSTLDLSDWMNEDGAAPAQLDGYNCGVFALYVMRQLAWQAGADDLSFMFDASHMTALRAQLIDEIVQHGIENDGE
jgi:Ulp1 family protease